MAQHASPNVIGHMLDSRAQLMACSRLVVITLSSNRPSSQPIIVTSCWCRFVSRPRSGRRQRFAWLLALGGNAAHPVQIAAPPQVSEANQQYAEEHDNIEKSDQCHAACRFGVGS